MKYTEEQIQNWKEKAERWDALGARIDKFYLNKDGEYSLAIISDGSTSWCKIEKKDFHRIVEFCEVVLRESALNPAKEACCGRCPLNPLNGEDRCVYE